MRKRFVTTILLCIVCALCAFGMSACDGLSGNEGGNEGGTGGGKGKISVEEIGLNASELEATLNEDSPELILSLYPAGATADSIEWASSDKEVLTVNDGEITLVSKGTAVITVTVLSDGNTFEKNCTVTVIGSVAGLVGNTFVFYDMYYEEIETNSWFSFLNNAANSTKKMQEGSTYTFQSDGTAISYVPYTDKTTEYKYTTEKGIIIVKSYKSDGTVSMQMEGEMTDSETVVFRMHMGDFAGMYNGIDSVNIFKLQAE